MAAKLTENEVRELVKRLALTPGTRALIKDLKWRVLLSSVKKGDMIYHQPTERYFLVLACSEMRSWSGTKSFKLMDPSSGEPFKTNIGIGPIKSGEYLIMPRRTDEADED